MKNLRPLITLLALSALSVAAHAADIAGVGFSPGNAEKVVVSTINSAKRTVRMAAYSFTSKPIAEALLEAKRRGVDVAVVIDKSQRTERYSILTFLRNEAIPVRVNERYAIMHNKFIIVDKARTETGSFNYTSAATRHNAENVIVVDDPEVADTYSKEWDRLWAESSPE